MSSNAYDELSAQGVHDTAAGVDPQSILTPPGPLADLGNLQFPRQPHNPLINGPAALHEEHQAGEDDANIMAVDGPEDPDVRRAQDVRLVPEENGAPPVVPQAHLLQRVPILVDLSHLPLNDLERVVDYVSGLCQDANLPVGEVERITCGLLTIGNQNRWDVGEIERVARDVVNYVHGEYMLEYDADDEEDGIRFVVLEPIEEPPRDRRLILERRNALIPPVEPQLAGAYNDPPPQYSREQAAPRNGIEVPELNVPETIYSITLQSRNGTHLHFEVVISFTIFISVACGVPIGIGMFVSNYLVRTVSGWAEGPISPFVNNALLKILNQAMDSWAMLVAVLDDLRTFVNTSVSIDVLGVVINLLVLVSLFYLIARMARMAMGGAVGMVDERA